MRGLHYGEKIKTKLGEFKKDFRKNFVDDKDPIKKIVEDITGGEKLAAEKDPYTLLRLNNGVTGKTRVALEYGILDEQGEKNKQKLSRSIRTC